MNFHVLFDKMIFVFWASLTIFMENAKHMTLVHSHFICLFMTLFHDFFELYRFEWQLLCIWYDSWKTYDLVSCFEGSLTSFSKIILTSYYSSFGSVFTIKIFSKLICENPFLSPYGRKDGRVCLASFIENLLPCAYEGW